MVRKIVFAIIVFISIACSEKKICRPDYISYSNEKYKENLNKRIKIYNSRLDLPDKFIEIGVLKNCKYCPDEEIIELGASFGAQAIIRDEKFNYVLIRFLKTEEESNEIHT